MDSGRTTWVKTLNILILCLVILYLECDALKVTKDSSPKTGDPSEKPNLHNGRKSKQYILPMASWPYSLGFGGTAGAQFSPMYLPVEYYYPSAFLSQSPTIVQGDSLNYATPGSSKYIESRVEIPCKTPTNEVGTCKQFTECFPMMEMQYGSANYMDYMDIPLAEQLVRNTNASVCSQSESVTENLKVCCPRPTYRNINELLHDNPYGDVTNYINDETARMPMITQRPPVRNWLFRRLANEHKCGVSKVNGKIVEKQQGKITGGQEALGPQEFPWMVAIFGKNKKIMCGASLITNQFLISAAHCFATFKPSDIQSLYVHLGDYNIKTTSDGPHEVRKIDKVIIHKGFKLENYHNDIALLKLDRPVNFTDRISPICLPEATMDSLEKRQIVVTGWGRQYRYGVTVDTLRKVTMPVWNWQECKNLYARFAPGRVLETNICAGDGKRNKDACLGDSGGPAVMFDGNKHVLIGITSWGKGCGSFPGVYTRTSKFLMWITKNMNQYAQ